MPQTRVEEILATIKPLASEYMRITGKPLGVTGEIAEYVVAQKLGLELASARTPGYDALRVKDGKIERVQVKGRVVGRSPSPGQRVGAIKQNADCDVVMLVLLDDDLDAIEIWEAPYGTIAEILSRPGSKARERGQLGVAAFKAAARKIWPSPTSTNQSANSCPECGKVFKNGWIGIDAHWKSRHNHIMDYDQAWPLLKSGRYTQRPRP
ncbi:hypothetical protein JHW45_14650 [Paracoccus stylophorae]|uniref:DUF6998 domain-containing protein n=1 Tax=Paracoccus stylophorae TaxID=659350 RepID=A0ABY7STB9_9RHOB|nr:hypothetical protein [Paracoccus stylophorae]WCR10290.1 hypothetical protein JHW45_14650 [Paracoccus stylophorae]